MKKVCRIIREEVIDSHITVGDVVDNPYFDANLDYIVIEEDGDVIGENIDCCHPIYDSRRDDDPPAELLIEEILYMTIRNGILVLEVH